MRDTTDVPITTTHLRNLDAALAEGDCVRDTRLSSVGDKALVPRQRTTGITDEDELPPVVVESIKTFRRDIMLAQTKLQERGTDTTETSLLVTSAFANLENIIMPYIKDEPRRGKAVGARFLREALPSLMMSSLFMRCYTKPRGYAGDFETIEMIYRAEPAGAGPIGRMIDGWHLATHASNAVRSRRFKIVNYVKTLLAQNAAERLAIASLAVGSGREIFDVFDAWPEAPIQVLGVDIDAGALAFCAVEARRRSLGQDKIILYRENLIRLALDRGQTQIPKQNLIYSMGLIDYLDRGLVVRLIDWAHGQLVPGGTLVLGNFASGNPDRPYMDYVLGWILIHRTPDELRDLFARSRFGRADVHIDTDASGIQLFAYCTKT
jgi:extracellular factor (EF) 3-hydroxypalmitic acid methyl ester biosynthesis protein